MNTGIKAQKIASTEEWDTKGEGKFAGYGFTYELTGDKVAASFLPPMLANDNEIAGAARTLISTAFNERDVDSPTMVPWACRGVSVDGIKFNGASHAFVAVAFEADNKGIDSLIIWKVAKDTFD